jgi:hypothetical protein
MVWPRLVDRGVLLSSGIRSGGSCARNSAGRELTGLCGTEIDEGSPPASGSRSDCSSWVSCPGHSQRRLVLPTEPNCRSARCHLFALDFCIAWSANNARAGCPAAFRKTQQTDRHSRRPEPDERGPEWLACCWRRAVRIRSLHAETAMGSAPSRVRHHGKHKAISRHVGGSHRRANAHRPNASPRRQGSAAT